MNSLSIAGSVPAMRMNLPRRSRGFTLIEMIAAFVIFAIAVGALMQILTMSMNNARRSADETRAALWAQSLLDNVGIGERVEAGSSSGEFDRKFRWRLDIEQIDPELVVAEVAEPSADTGIAPQAVPPAAGLAPGFDVPQIDLFHVELTVFWGDSSREREAHFTTLRTSRPDPVEGSRNFGLGVQTRNMGTSRNSHRGRTNGEKRQ
jgi:general secretion pathway protein I